MEIAETLKKLVDLQKTDSGLDELEKLKKGFRLEIENLEGGVAGLKAQIQEEKKSLEDLLKQRKTLEIEVATLEARITKYTGQENEVKSNEQFAALKHEIEKSREEKAQAEEKILEFLFKEDERKQKAQELAGRLAQAEKKAVEDRKILEQKIADCEKSAQDKREERKKQIVEVPEEFARGYESLRNHGKKIAVAEVKEDLTCGGCHMDVPPQTLNEMKKNIGIPQCNCGRFLYVRE